MHSVLARASQAQNCCCKACRQVTKTVTRRATTQPSRKVSTAQAFTVLYSSIFATAAVVDAKRKDDRRKSLDAQIAEAKDAIARLQLQNVSGETHTSAEPTGDSLPTASGASIADSIGQYATETRKSDLWEQYGGGLWEPFHPRKAQMTLQALRYVDERRLKKQMWRHGGEAAFGSKLQDLEYGVSELVAELLGRADWYAMEQSSSAGEPSPLRIAIERLIAKGYPNFRRHGPTFFQGVMDREMAMAWRDLRRMVDDINRVSRRTADRSKIIEHVCYSLLTSPFAPSPHTYNTLILHLQRQEHHRVARDILRAHFAHFGKHNWETEVAALTLDRRTKQAVYVDKNVAVLLEEPSKYPAGWQHMFEAMINAYMRLSKLPEAAAIVCQSLCAGCSIHARILIQVLGWCIFKLDRETAVMIVKDLVENPLALDAMLAHRKTSHAVLVQQIYYLLDMCDLWRRPSKLVAQLEEYGMDPQLFREFRVNLAIRDIDRQLNQIQAATVKVYKILREKKKDWVTMAAKARHAFDYNIEATMPRSWLHCQWKTKVKMGNLEATQWNHEEHREARSRLRVVRLANEARSVSQNIVRLTIQLGKLKGIMPADVEGALRRKENKVAQVRIKAPVEEAPRIAPRLAPMVLLGLVDARHLAAHADPAQYQAQLYA